MHLQMSMNIFVMMCADEDDMTREEYIVSLNACTYTELIAETSTDDTFYQFEQWFEHWDY
jgi:hypothetical protein